MKRKFLSTLVAVAMFATVFSGCSGKDASQNTDNAEVTENANEELPQAQELQSGKVDLRLWIDEGSVSNTQKMIDSFKQQYAGQADLNIAIETVEISQVREFLLGDINNGPDVYVFVDDQLSPLVSSGVIDIVPNASEIAAANLTESVEAATLLGNMYAYPMTADNGYFLYYNKNYLSESDVQTMDRILEVASENEKKMLMDMTSGWYMYSFFGNTGLEMGINSDGLTNHCNWNSTEGDITGAEVVQAILDITTNPGFMSGLDDELFEGAKNGTVIAGVSGVWAAAELKEAWGDGYAACKLPTYTCDGKQIQMSSFTGYKMVGVNYYSKQKAWAHKFADWITNEENQTLRFADRMQGPSNTNAAASELVSKEPAIKAVIEQSQFGVLQRIGNNYWKPCVEFGNIMIEGNPSQMPLQDIIDRLVNGIIANAV